MNNIKFIKDIKHIPFFFISSIFNILLAGLLGIFLDDTVNYYIKDKIKSIILQTILCVLIVMILNYIYFLYNFGSMVNNVFFIAVFLGVQTVLFKKIETLKFIH